MKKVVLAVALLAAPLFTASYVIPAAGAPNPIAEAAQLITGRQIANNTITGKKIRNRSLTRRDFSGSVRGPRGLPGAPGPRGPQGVPGPINVSGIQTITGPQNTIAVADPMTGLPSFQSSIAFCPAGQRVVSGGGNVITPFLDGLSTSEPTNDRSGWFVIAGNNSTVTEGTVQARALCAGGGSAVTARSPRATARRQVERIMARIEALQRAAR